MHNVPLFTSLCRTPPNAATPHPTNTPSPTFHHPQLHFTTRPAMDKAIEDSQAREGGEEHGYRNTARIFGVAESTL
jgi:hypothetical protein